MKHAQFHQRKNDFCFAFLIAAVFAITLVGAVAGSLDLVRGRAGGESAKTQEVSVALRGPGEQASNVAHTGAK